MARTRQLRERIRELEARVAELEAELDLEYGTGGGSGNARSPTLLEFAAATADVFMPECEAVVTFGDSPGSPVQ